MTDTEFIQAALQDFQADDYKLWGEASNGISIFGGGSAIGPLCEILRETDNGMKIHLLTVALMRLASRSVPQLLAALMDRNGKVRAAVAWALGYGKDAVAVGPLLRCRHDEDVRVRQAIIHSLGLLGAERSLQPLIDLLHDPDYRISSGAAQALGKLGCHESIQALIETLDDTGKDVAAYAAVALGTIGGEEVVEPLIRCLDHRWRKVRAHAADALGSLRDPRAVEPLIRLLPIAGSAITSYIKALGAIGDRRAIGPLLSLLPSPLRAIRNGAARALVQLGAQDEMRAAGYEELCTRAANGIGGMAAILQNHPPQALTSRFEQRHREDAEEYRRQVAVRVGGGAG